MPPILSIQGLTKTYAGGFQALKGIDLTIEAGEIFALLGPNGAGKTTLISIVCGLVNASSGKIEVAGHDIVDDFRRTRAMIGLVPQEVPNETFETVHRAVGFSRGLFGLPPDPGHIESVLRSMSLWDRRDAPLMTLSGGMKRRVLIAKALAHEPRLLFLDEPTAGVDVELRQDMWAVVRELRRDGVTVVLTTHYIEEAEELADRVGVINHGELVMAEDKSTLMRELGKKQLCLHLTEPVDALPSALAGHALELNDAGDELIFTYDTQQDRTGITALLADLQSAGIAFNDLYTSQSSLEDIFVDLVRKQA